LLIDAAAEGGLTSVYLNFEAGWINEADRILGVRIDPLLERLVRHGRERKVGLAISIEYAGMEDKAASDELFRKVRLFQMSGGQVRSAVSGLRKTLCADGREYYLQAARRALAWRPQSLVVSFDDFPPRQCPDGVEIYNGKTMAAIASDVAALTHGGTVYFLPRFYGPTHWKAHPRALPELLENSPATVKVIVAGDPDEAYLKPLRAKYPGRFAFWMNLTSNHMKEKKVWFPTAELSAAQPLDKLRGTADAEIIVNLGSPPAPQRLSAIMAGQWLRRREGFDAAASLADAARKLLGAEYAAPIGRYAALIDWPEVSGSLAWNVLPHLKDRAALAAQIRSWQDSAEKAGRASKVAQAIAGEMGRMLVLNAERIRRDYQVAVLAGKMTLDRTPASEASLRQAVSELAEFIQRYPVIENDPKDAEVVARGFRMFQELVTPSPPK